MRARQNVRLKILSRIYPVTVAHKMTTFGLFYSISGNPLHFSKSSLSTTIEKIQLGVFNRSVLLSTYTFHHYWVHIQYCSWYCPPSSYTGYPTQEHQHIAQRRFTNDTVLRPCSHHQNDDPHTIPSCGIYIQHSVHERGTDEFV